MKAQTGRRGKNLLPLTTATGFNHCHRLTTQLQLINIIIILSLEGDWVGPSAALDVYGKSRPPPGFDPRTVQPVDSRYTEYEGDIIWVSWDCVK